MFWLPLIALLSADAADASVAPGTLEKPTLSWRSSRTETGRLALFPVGDGWLALVAMTAKVQFRSPAGTWSKVTDLPVDTVLGVARADPGILIAGRKKEEYRTTTVFFIDIDGRTLETWQLSREVHSLAAWQGRRWATVSDGTRRQSPGFDLIELLPKGSFIVRDKVPPAEDRGEMVRTSSVFLHFGPSGERIYCSHLECTFEDGPCHSGFCYRQDTVQWIRYGSWLGIRLCGGYLLENEYASGVIDHFEFTRNRTVVRRISDGNEAGSINFQKRDAHGCAGPDELLLASDTVTSVSLPSGRRLWSVPVPRSVGRAIAVARAGVCTIALTTKDAILRICPGEGQKMVTTIAR